MKKILALTAATLLAVSCGLLHKVSTGDYAPGTDPGEELVNTGYGSIKGKDSTSSISRLDVKQGSGYSDIYEYIKGRVAGVDVVGTSITIRGVRSITGSNEPLILVDGIETSDISGISPDMVEKIEVLKDASSTALYGFRGANGVILISTRKSIDK